MVFPPPQPGPVPVLLIYQLTTQAGLAEAHHRLRTFKNSVSSEVQGVTNSEDGAADGSGRTLEKHQKNGETW